MSKATKNKIIKWAVFFVIVVAVAAALEVCAFNFKPVTVRLGWRQDETRLFSAEDIDPESLQGCTLQEGTIVLTGEEASFSLTGLGFELNTVRAVYRADAGVSVSGFFDSSREDKTVPLKNGAMNEYIDGVVSAVRITVRGEAGDTLSSLQLIVNDYQFAFSWARFIAMIVVCCVTRALFGLQHTPDFGLDVAAQSGEGQGEGQNKGQGAEPAAKA